MGESRSASDVSAVVLTIGETTTPRAVASLEAQTLPIADVHMVEGVTPMARALNTGAGRVTTPFFLQVDADMVLHPRCADVLRDAMGDSVGIAVGTLEDPLMGRITGVKMFRRECFDAARMPESVAQDLDFVAELARLGWSTRWILGGGTPRVWGSLGEHQPEYDPDYVFGTYHQLGARYAQREDERGLHWRFGALRRSRHAMAPVARLALARGLASGELRDTAKPRPAPADASFLAEVARGLGNGHHAVDVASLMSLAPGELVAAFGDLGARLRASSPEAVSACLRALAEVGPRSVPAEIAFAQGVLADGPA